MIYRITNQSTPFLADIQAVFSRGVIIRKFAMRNTDTDSLLARARQMKGNFIPPPDDPVVELVACNSLDEVRLLIDRSMQDMRSAFASRINMLEHHLEQQMKLLRAEDTWLKTQMARVLADYALAQGMFPDMGAVSLLEIQVWHTPELTTKQRQGGHTNWSLKIEVSANGRRVHKGIDVGLFDGSTFVKRARGLRDISSALEQALEAAQSDPDGLYGMVRALTQGNGRPFCGTQFCRLRGHHIDLPQVQVYVDDRTAKCSKFGPAKGSKAGHAKWYGTCKPEPQC
jgi:hypothetical protein